MMAIYFLGVLAIGVQLVSAIPQEKHRGPPPPPSPTPSPFKFTDLETHVIIYINKFRWEIESGNGSLFIENKVSNAVKEGRKEDYLYSKQFYKDTFEEMLRKKILGHDREGFKKDIQAQINLYGTLSAAQVQEVYDRLIPELRKKFKEELDYHIDDIISTVKELKQKDIID
ncbi:hypothetical protein WDU94_000228 [Cyamophila willieti]